jgi:hypothetical protein
MAVTGQHLVGREDELEALVDLLETPERLPQRTTRGASPRSGTWG